MIDVELFVTSTRSIYLTAKDYSAFPYSYFTAKEYSITYPYNIHYILIIHLFPFSFTKLTSSRLLVQVDILFWCFNYF